MCSEALMVGRRLWRTDGSVAIGGEEMGGGWSCRMKIIQVVKA